MAQSISAKSCQLSSDKLWFRWLTKGGGVRVYASRAQTFTRSALWILVGDALLRLRSLAREVKSSTLVVGWQKNKKNVHGSHTALAHLRPVDGVEPRYGHVAVVVVDSFNLSCASNTPTAAVRWVGGNGIIAVAC